MPLIVSNLSSVARPASTMISPCAPVAATASAIKRPICASPLAVIVAIWAIWSLWEIGLAAARMRATTVATARSMPFFTPTAPRLAATARAPARSREWANTVAVVAPSPALAPVSTATRRRRRAPILANVSANSIRAAMVAPSLVTWGPPRSRSSRTLRPRGPSVTLTALAIASAPRMICVRPASPNTIFASVTESTSTPSRRDRRARLRVGLEAFELSSLLLIAETVNVSAPEDGSLRGATGSTLRSGVF